jgi:hypothetical protein
MAKPTLRITKRTAAGIPIRASCPVCNTEFSTEAFDDDPSYPHERTLNEVFETDFAHVHVRETNGPG